MSPSILESGQSLVKQQVDQVRTEKPQQFTVGGYLAADGTITAAVTYDRKWSNGWGATAYIHAWWNDLNVTAHPKFEAGGEVVKKF